MGPASSAVSARRGEVPRGRPAVSLVRPRRLMQWLIEADGRLPMRAEIPAPPAPSPGPPPVEVPPPPGPDVLPPEVQDPPAPDATPPVREPPGMPPPVA